MAIATYTSQNFPNASVNPQYYLQKEVLDSADTYQVLDTLFDKYTMPSNANGFIGFRRYLTPAAAATALPEGTNATPRAIVYEDFSVPMLRYGEMFQISRNTYQLTPFDVLDANKEQLTKLVTLDHEAVRWAAAQTITNKLYNSSAVSSVPGVNGPLTPGRIQVATRSILSAKGNYFDGNTTGVNKEGTSPTQASFAFVCHTNLIPDIDALPGFQQVAYSPSGKPKHITHYGNWKNVCIYTSQEAPILAGQGAATTSLLATGGNADVYPILIFGKNSFGSVSLSGAGKAGYGNFDLKILDQPDKYDPMNQWVDIVATWWDAALPTTNSWAWLLYVGATANP